MDGTQRTITINEFNKFALKYDIKDHEKKVIIYLFSEKVSPTSKPKLIAAPTIEVYSKLSNALAYTIVPVNDYKKGVAKAYKEQESIAQFLEELDLMNVKYDIRRESKFIKSLADIQALATDNMKKDGIAKASPVSVETKKKIEKPVEAQQGLKIVKQDKDGTTSEVLTTDTSLVDDDDFHPAFS